MFSRVTPPRWCAGTVELYGQILAADRREGLIGPEVGVGDRLGQRIVAEPADVAALERMGLSSPPVIRQWNTSDTSGMRVKPRRCPSRIAMGRTTSHSMPVSSHTSFTTTSAGE